MDLREKLDTRSYSVATTDVLNINVDAYDGVDITALASGLTINAPTGSPDNLQPLVIRIKDNGTSRALTWNAAFRVVGVTLPTATTISKYHVIGCIYNAADDKYDVVGVNEEA